MTTRRNARLTTKRHQTRKENMTDMITLYHRPGTRAGRVKMLVDLMEVDYRLEHVDNANGQNRSDAYLALNPFGSVPTLTHGDLVLLESGAQMMYLADLFPDRNMAPPLGTPERAKYYEWFVLNGATLEPLGAAGFLNPEDPEAVKGMHLSMHVLQERIVGPYCLGARFSAVDVLVHWQLHLIQSAGALKAMPKADDYYHTVSEKIDWAGY
jgi:glutathione S-transferase